MKGNVVVAAVIFALGPVGAAGIFVWGLRAAATDLGVRIESAVGGHGKSVERAGSAAGEPIRDALGGVQGSVDRHAASLEKTGGQIARPVIDLKGPLILRQPVQIEGTAPEGALKVDARLAK
ncbi:MAG TPA: hypothetical protein VF796_19290 [Humisphaera sp.]